MGQCPLEQSRVLERIVESPLQLLQILESIGRFTRICLVHGGRVLKILSSRSQHKWIASQVVLKGLVLLLLLLLLLLWLLLWLLWL